MKKLALFVAIIISLNSYGIENSNTKYNFPHIVMANGTVANLSFNNKTNHLDCTLYNNIGEVSVTIYKDGVAVDEVTTFVENDLLSLDMTFLPKGNYEVYVENEEETLNAGNVEVTTDNN